MGKPRRSVIWTCEKIILEEHVKNANSLADILRKLNCATVPHNYSALKQRLNEEGIDYKNIRLGWGSNKGRKFKPKARSLEDCKKQVFIIDAKISKTQVKAYLKRYNLIEYKCAECGLEKEWNYKPLALQIDHINGKSEDHRLENLRWICPNCHSQTATFAGRASRRQAIERFCHDCGIKINKKYIGKYNTCRSCSDKKRGIKTRKIERPTKIELKEMLEILPVLAIAKKYNITSNAIRQWCEHYKLNYKEISPFSHQNKMTSRQQQVSLALNEN